MFDPLSLLALFAPVVVDAGKAAVRRFIQPDGLTAAEKLQLNQQDIDRLKTLADLDKPAENVYPWVSSVRALMRPFVAVSVTMAWCFNPTGVDVFLVSSVWFYLFGERTLTK